MEEIQEALTHLEQQWQQWRRELTYNQEFRNWWQAHSEIKDIADAFVIYEHEGLKARNAAAALGKLNLPKRYRYKTLDNYYPKSASQHAALELCRGYNSNNKDKNSIYLSGTTRVGKTHLACATLISQVQEHEINGYFCQLSPLLTKYKQSLFERMSTYRDVSNGVYQFDIAKSSQLLLIDDFGAEKDTEWQWEKIFELIEHRVSNELPMIITSNLMLEYFMRVENLNAIRIASRLIEVCNTIHITGPKTKGER